VETIKRRLSSWASVLEDATREQAVTSSGMPFLFPHLALMPDAHLGKGATLGSVIPTERAIMPPAVGVDIGCGMAAVRTQLTAADLRARGPLVPLREAIERAVPLSAGRYNAKIVATAEPRVAELTALAERDAGVDLTRSRNCAAAGDAGLGQPLHQGHPRRAGPGVGVPALQVTGRGQRDRPAPHRGHAAAPVFVLSRNTRGPSSYSLSVTPRPSGMAGS